MSKQVQVVQTSLGFYIQIDGRDVDGPLSQRELIDEMRHYNNDPSYKILPPRKMNASFANGRQRAMNAISEKLNAFKLGYKGEADHWIR